ncbi:PX domain-containing protein [Aphelenchoides avenae]|nr:PX domain-containing protein [Aphelenchus avenae]
MIHITIPSYQTLTENLDQFKKYTVFDIHVNGAYHASVRYNVLYALHERLVENFGLRFTGPEFPPKKIWRSLDSKSLNERREGLAKYFQGVIQNPDIAKHPVLERAFLEFQVTSFSPTIQNVKLEIFLPDGRPTVVDCYSDDGTSLLMQKLCKALGMDEKHSSAFGLFLSKDRHIGEEDNGTTSGVLFDQLCVRWLKNFEAPYISQKLSNRESDKTGVYHKILVRRVTWDPSVEEPLLDDPGCVKVLYLQALNDLQRGVLRVSPEVKAKLAALHDQSCFKQFIRLCHLQPSYGYEVLAPVVSDFPSKDTECELKVGRRQIVLEYKENNMIVQSCLRSTRIRVWRVSHTDTNPNAMLFQIEYLVGKDEFNIITLSTSQVKALACLDKWLVGWHVGTG